MNLDNYEEVQRTRVLVYGQPKAGKTALVGELASKGFTLWWVDCESGVKTLMNPAILEAKFRQNVNLINIPDSRSLPLAFNAVRRILKGGDCKFCFEHGAHMCPICTKAPGAKWSSTINISKFTEKDILVVDSLTQVADSALNQITLADWRKGEDYKLTFNDFGNQGQYMRELLLKVQTSGINICMISHQMDADKSDSKEKIVPVSGTRNFSLTVAKYFDSVVYMQVQNKQHRAYSSSTWDNVHVTGSRSSHLLDDKSGKELSLAPFFLTAT